MRLRCDSVGRRRLNPDIRQEGVRVLRQAGAGGKGQVVAEIRGAVLQLAGPQDRAGGRVGHGHVSLGKLHDHRLGRTAWQRRLADQRRVRHRVSALLHPLEAVQHLRNRGGAWHVVDDWRQIAQRHVFIEVQIERHRHVGCRRQVEQLRLARGQAGRSQEAEHAESRHLGNRAAGHVRHTGLDIGFNPQQLGAVDAAKRLTRVVNALRVEIGCAVTVNVDANLDLPHQLHQVDHGLAQAVPAADDGARRRGVHAFGAADGAVTVLIKTSPACGYADRRATGGQHIERAQRTAAVADHVDGQRGDASRGKHRADCPRRTVHAVGEAVAENRHRPAARRLGAGRHEELEDQVTAALRARAAVERGCGRDRLARCQIAGRAELAIGQLRDRAVHDVQRRRRQKAGRERRCCAGLTVELNALQAAQREHGAHRRRARSADHEAGWRGRAGLDLPHDLGHVASRCLRGEHGRCGHPASTPMQARRIAQFTPVLVAAVAAQAACAIVAIVIIQMRALDRLAVGIAHAAGHDQHIARMFGQQFIGLEHQRVGGRVPQALVDADALAQASRGQHVTQVQQVHGVTRHAVHIDGAGKRHGDARLGRKSVEAVDDRDVFAVAHPHGAVGRGQVDAAKTAVAPVALRVAVAGKGAAGQVAGVEFDPHAR